MTNSAADAVYPPADTTRAPRASRRTPRRQPPAVLVTWGALLALATAALLEVVPLSETSRLLVAFGVLVLVIALGTWSQLRFWGTLVAPSFAPSRFAVVIVGVSMTSLLANFPESVGLSARIGVVLVAPLLMVALLTWDDADTVAKLREEQEKPTRGEGTASGRV